MPQVCDWENHPDSYQATEKVHGLTAVNSFIQRAPWQNILFILEESVKIRVQVAASVINYVKTVKNRWIAYRRSIDRHALYWGFCVIINRTDRHFDQEKPAPSQE